MLLLVWNTFCKNFSDGLHKFTDQMTTLNAIQIHSFYIIGVFSWDKLPNKTSNFGKFVILHYTVKCTATSDFAVIICVANYVFILVIFVFRDYIAVLMSTMVQVSKLPISIERQMKPLHIPCTWSLVTLNPARWWSGEKNGFLEALLWIIQEKKLHSSYRIKAGRLKYQK